MIIFYGKCIIDNVHCQEDELSYEELIEEDSRYLIDATVTEI